jgi:hypothetical protein
MGGIEGNPTWAAKKKKLPEWTGGLSRVGAKQGDQAKRTGCVSLAFASGNCKD